MREWSPYGEVSPRHLHGYLISKRPIPADAIARKPYAARRDLMVSARPVAGGVLAVVERCDYLPHPYAGAESHPDVGGSGREVNAW
jgi:hypothetical protein